MITEVESDILNSNINVCFLFQMIESIKSSCLKSQHTEEMIQFIEWKFSDAFSLKDDDSISSPDERDLLEVKLNTSVIDHGS